MALKFSIVQHSHDNWPVQYEMEWPDLAARLARHDVGEKDGVAILGATFRDTRGTEGLLERHLVLLDIEESKTGEIPPTPESVVSNLNVKRLAGVVWTTHGHTPMLPRYRIALPLSEPMFPAKFGAGFDRTVTEVVAANLRLIGVLDTSKRSSASIFYLARHAKGAPYYSAISEGEPLNAKDLFAVAYMSYEKDVMKAAQREELRNANQFPPEIKLLIDTFNDSYELPELFSQYGYIRQGDRWKSPYQHGNGATCILPDHSRWVSFSDSDTMMGVGQKAASDETCFGDAFQLFVHYEHKGSFRDALAALRKRYEKS